MDLSKKDIELLNSKDGLYALLRRKKVNLKRALKEARYAHELNNHQEKLIKLQNWVIENDKKVVIIFEGRDAAGKGGAIRRLTERINIRPISTGSRRADATSGIMRHFRKRSDQH